MPLAFVPCVICVVKGERVGGWEEVVVQTRDSDVLFFSQRTPQRCHLSRRLSRGLKSLQYFFCCLLSRNSTSRTRAATRTKSVSCFANPRFGSTASANARLVDDGRCHQEVHKIVRGCGWRGTISSPHDILQASVNSLSLFTIQIFNRVIAHILSQHPKFHFTVCFQSPPSQSSPSASSWADLGPGTGWAMLAMLLPMAEVGGEERLRSLLLKFLYSLTPG